MRAGRSSTLNFVMGRAPDCPASKRDQVSSTPHASGVTRPRPVTTTLRMPLTATEKTLRLCLVDILHGIADRDDGLGGVVRNFDAEFLFERHDEFDRVETVGAQIFD